MRSDWFVYVVLSCLPWVGKELYEKKDVEMDRLLSQIEGYLKWERLHLDYWLFYVLQTFLCVFNAECVVLKAASEDACPHVAGVDSR